MTWISANTNLLGIRYRTSKRYELGYNISAYNVALLAAQEDADHYSKVLKQIFLRSDPNGKLRIIRIRNEIEGYYADKIQMLNAFYEKLQEAYQHKNCPPIYLDYLAICKTALININLLKNEAADEIVASDKKYNAIITLKSLLRWLDRISEAAQGECFVNGITRIPLTDVEIKSAKEVTVEFKEK